MDIRKLKDQFVDFFNTPLGSQVKYYAMFYLFLWGFHLIIISLISFFHLLLNHNIRTIGDWIGDRGWGLIIFSKLAILYIALQFIRLKSKKISLIQNYFRNSIQLPRKEILVVLIFLLMGLMGVGKISTNPSIIFEISRMALSILGTFILFSVDYALLIILETFYPIKNQKELRLKLFLFPLLFYCFTYATFIYEQNVSFRLYAYFYLLIYLGEWRRRNWTLPLLLLISFLIPSFSFFGLDPVWGANYSFFVMQRIVSTFSIFILIALSTGYLYLVQKNNPEYIYRD